jgi:hypothetical protein
LTDEGWNQVLDVPECQAFCSRPFINEEKNMVIGCAEPDERHYRVNGVWETIPFPGDGFGKMSCLDIDHCLFWRDDNAVICSRSQCDDITEFSPIENGYDQFVWRDQKRLYALFHAAEGDDFFYYPYRYDLQTKEWEEETRVSYTFQGIIARINENYTAYSRRGAEEGVFILDGDDGLIETSWPYMYRLAFAPGGGGIGFSSITDEVYQINGMNLLPLGSYLSISTDFFIATDAE